eukprot:gnl/MRDRNA2_/MRDRNA2_93354_c0_seq1.p1 gnl/MRDRNA2_/MRDRNA2_93354_c0~~gnl/MRDRNA2_/MRDRNA2_93354_c0_seq1.p1  ORF type:complete len:152 (+),score=51.94 gnl/MRDRNA2_/MRDRNA2_93354_c0_seq1:79-534(+)
MMKVALVLAHLYLGASLVSKPTSMKLRKEDPDDDVRDEMLQGQYLDPNHSSEGGNAGSRQVWLDPENPGQVLMKGVDELGGEEWNLKGAFNKDATTITMDFSPKGGPKELVGTVDEEGIHWPDGNVWRKTDDELDLPEEDTEFPEDEQDHE